MKKTDKNKPVTCESKLKPNEISNAIYLKEIKLCEQLGKENGGKCCWGECKSCGVFPLLYKLHKGVLLEKKEDIEEAKREELEAAK